MPRHTALRYASILAGPALALLFVLASPQGLALPEDRDQPIHITANKAIRDEKRGVTIYTGNVQMRQGSMEVEADKLVIYHENEDANKIVARGEPARMRQLPEPDKGLVHAEANEITYFRIEERVHLQVNASIEQDGDLVTGSSIDYFIDKQLVKAESDQNDKENKVIVVIQPRPQQEQAGSSRTAPPEPATTPEAAPESDQEPGEPNTSGAAQSE